MFRLTPGWPSCDVPWPLPNGYMKAFERCLGMLIVRIDRCCFMIISSPPVPLRDLPPLPVSWDLHLLILTIGLCTSSNMCDSLQSACLSSSCQSVFSFPHPLTPLCQFVPRGPRGSERNRFRQQTIRPPNQGKERERERERQKRERQCNSSSGVVKLSTASESISLFPVNR